MTNSCSSPTFGSSSSSEHTSEDGKERKGFGAHVLLFSQHQQPCRVVATEHPDEGFFLPFLEYDDTHPFSHQTCCDDLANALNLNSHPSPFRVVAELMPPENDETTCSLWNPLFERVLLVVPSTAIDLDTIISKRNEDHAKFIRALAFRDILADPKCYPQRGTYRFILSAIWHCFRPCYESPQKPLVYCGHQRLHNMSLYFEQVIRSLGLKPQSCMERHPRTSMSYIFTINTENGLYYLKAPLVASAEISITECIASLFPNLTLDIKGINHSLNCFVSKEYTPYSHPPFAKGVIYPTKLAFLQMESLKHLDALRQAGVPDYSPKDMASRLDELASHPEYMAAFESYSISKDLITSTLRDLCAKLDGSGFPNTVVHGDFSFRNFGMRDDVAEDGGLVFFDWEMTCISHPFCDMSSKSEWDPEAEQEYLECWSRYVAVEEGSELARVGRILGILAKIFHQIDAASRGTEEKRLLSQHVKWFTWDLIQRLRASDWIHEEFG